MNKEPALVDLDVALAYAAPVIPFSRLRSIATGIPGTGGHSRLYVEKLGDFLAREIKPRGMVMSPILPEQGLAMLYSWRGVGKTHVGIGIATSVATGAEFLKWNAEKPRGVLYVDGEMPAALMKERLAAVVKGCRDPDLAYKNLRIITPDLQDLGGMPNLSTPEGQQAIEPCLFDGCELLVIDNIATLCRAGKENEADSWTSMQEWLLRLRRRGISVLLLHHAGKGGAQRGTSHREDILDTSIRLAHPRDYREADGARFEIYYEKARGLFGADAEPFEAKLEVRDGVACWTMRSVSDANLDRAAELFAAGMSVRDVAEELGVSKSAAGRLRQQVETAGTA